MLAAQSVNAPIDRLQGTLRSGSRKTMANVTITAGTRVLNASRIELNDASVENDRDCFEGETSSIASQNTSCPRNSDPLIKSQGQNGPAPNINKKSNNSRRASPVFDNGNRLFCSGSGTERAQLRIGPHLAGSLCRY
jgi:hypothetical protein